jgi:type IV pilus assembly protein PilV
MPMRTNVFTSVYTSTYLTRRTQREAGFSFIDVLLSLVVLSFGVLALADLQVIAVRGNSSSQHLTSAMSVAEQKLETIKTLAYTSIATEAATPVTAADGTTYTRTVTVATDSPVANAKTVIVTVTWQDRLNRTHTVPMATVISQ